MKRLPAALLAGVLVFSGCSSSEPAAPTGTLFPPTTTEVEVVATTTTVASTTTVERLTVAGTVNRYVRGIVSAVAGSSGSINFALAFSRFSS